MYVRGEAVSLADSLELCRRQLELLMPRQVRPTVLVAYATFVLLGITGGTGGVLLPSQMASYGVSRAMIGITFFTVSVGFVLASLSTGAMLSRLGARMSLTAGGGALLLSGLYLATRPPFVAFVLAQVVTGYGVGILESVLMACLAALPGATTLINRLHAFWGIGALLGPPLAAWIIGFTSWTVVWLVQARTLPQSLAGYAVSGYWLGLTLGRFLISPIAARARVTTAGMIYACLAGVTVAATLAWLSPAALACVALGLLGFFLGPVFPTTVSITPRLTQARLVPTAIGVMNAGAVIGGSALPWLAGTIAQDAGMQALLPFVLALSLAQFAVWRPIAARLGRRD
jgi:fucose permease